MTLSPPSVDSSDASVRQDQARRPAHAEKLRPGRQVEIADAVDTRRKDERRARAGGLVECALECAALVVGRSSAHAELRCVKAIGREWRGERGGAGDAAHQKSAAINRHDAHHAPGKLTPCCRSQCQQNAACGAGQIIDGQPVSFRFRPYRSWYGRHVDESGQSWAVVFTGRLRRAPTQVVAQIASGIAR